MTAQLDSAPFISTDGLLAHWEGHRALTRRMIESYPEDQLFTFSVGGMRPFGELVREMLGMGAPMISGLATGEWKEYATAEAGDRATLLAMWDRSTEDLNRLWRQIPPERFREKLTAFGQYKDVAYNLVLYVIDNEIHHRGQGYVYMRALGVEPPAFWER